MLSRTATFAARSVSARNTIPLVSRRCMSGGKNKHIEEWNNVREDFHKSFELTSSNFPTVAFLGGIVPVALYLWIKEEEYSHGDKGKSFNLKKNDYM